VKFVNDSVVARKERRKKESRQGITKKGIGETNKQIRMKEMKRVG